MQRCTLSFFRAPSEAGRTFFPEASRTASLPGKRCAPEGPFPHRRHIPYFSRRTACLAGDGGVPPHRKHPHYLTLRCYARQGTRVIHPVRVAPRMGNVRYLWYCAPRGKLFYPSLMRLGPRRRRGPKKSFSLHPNGQQNPAYPSHMGGIILCSRQPNTNST